MFPLNTLYHKKLTLSIRYRALYNEVVRKTLNQNERQVNKKWKKCFIPSEKSHVAV